jgi:uroporphyrin-III C-methyltransferase/precorrin-2 dehydrogenase/sirohydrochlorin ferrochelatase
MDFMPFFFNLRDRDCLLVGGGSIATRKARLIQKAGARLIVVAPYITDELQSLVEKSHGQCFLRSYQSEDLELGAIVICATDDEEINRQVSAEAQKKKLPVNVVDSPELCSIITPSIVDRSPIMIAISSGGEAPVLARQIRAKLEVHFPASYGSLAKFASQFRGRVRQLFSSGDVRLRFWERFFDGPVAEQVFVGKTEQAENAVEKLFAEFSDVENTKTNLAGEVYLVGGGPGDPDLLTFKALRLMQKADVVLYDRLVSEDVLNLVRRDAERIYVGKRRQDHAVPQQNINQLLVDLAKQGKRVLRLKGGDPFIFGRGGEEIELLAENQIPFQVVPGITAASGCAAYSGIPLTHRDHAQSVRFITGHTKSSDINLPWDSLMDPNQTLVFYMGLVNLKQIFEELVRRGRSADTPAALVEKGTTVNQRVFTGTLESLPELVIGEDVHAPTLLIVGGVVSLHSQLEWFEPQNAESTAEKQT